MLDRSLLGFELIAFILAFILDSVHLKTSSDLLLKNILSSIFYSVCSKLALVSCHLFLIYLVIS